jgi:hypothetical protein
MKTKQGVNTELIKMPNKKEQIARPLEVMNITSNCCIQKGECPSCGRGDRFGIPLHFIFHLEDGSIKTVCYACGKSNASKFGLKLPPTESDIFAHEEKADMRLIRIARQKIEANNE